MLGRWLRDLVAVLITDGDRTLDDEGPFFSLPDDSDRRLGHCAALRGLDAPGDVLGGLELRRWRAQGQGDSLLLH